MNYHRCSLNNMHLLSYNSVGQKSTINLTRLKSRWGQGYIPSGCFRSISCLFYFPQSAHIPWLLVSFLCLYLQSNNVAFLPSLMITASDHSQARFSTFKDSCDHIRSAWIIRDALPIAGSLTLNSSAKSLFLRKVTYSQVPGFRMRAFRWGSLFYLS